MEQTYQPTSTDLFNEQQAPKGLPGMLNVLTILTFIRCGYDYIMLLIGAFAQKDPAEQREQMEEMQDKIQGSGMEKFTEGAMEMAQKSWENRYILLASGLIFTTMCLIGALQMRKLKKSGFPIYVIGEVAPIVISAVLIGFSLVGGIMTIVSSVFALLFVILYATQRKYLIN